MIIHVQSVSYITCDLKGYIIHNNKLTLCAHRELN